jgi:ATP-dependent DNA helicase RecG
VTDGSAYCRESDRSRRLTETEKIEIRINKGERRFELEACPLEYPGDFRTREIARFAVQIRVARDGSEDVSDEQILESMRLGRIKDGKFVPNNVCALLFAKDPKQVFPGAYVHFLRYNGTEEKTGKDYNVTKDRIIEGTVLDIIKDTAATLDANLREFTVFKGGKFFQTPEYPHDAWYEVLVNACVHRSYHAKTRPIFVKMFDDHLVIENPGGFMPSVTPENFFHKPRNPFLMLALREFGEVRCISEGTKRIKRELQDANLPKIEYWSDQNTVRATLDNDVANRTNSLDSEAYKRLGEVVAFSLDPDERRIVNYAIEHGKINASDALRILRTTYWHTAKGKLTRLVDRGILKFVSKKHRDPNSHYVIHSGFFDSPPSAPTPRPKRKTRKA